MPEGEDELRGAVLGRLNEIKDPCSVAAGVSIGLDDMGVIKSVAISLDGDVRINLRLTSPACHMVAYMTEEAIARVGALPGVRSVEVAPDAGLDWSPTMISRDAQQRRLDRLTRMDRAALRRRAAARARVKGETGSRC
jgi:metal-sulfur cluster biosynthetic enzyme